MTREQARDLDDRAEALINWFNSQDISPTLALTTMGFVVTSILSEMNDPAKTLGWLVGFVHSMGIDADLIKLADNNEGDD